MNFINKISLFNRRKRENYNQSNNEKFNHDNNDKNNNTKIDCSLTKLYENVTSINFTTSSTLPSTSQSSISQKYLPSLTISSSPPPPPSSLLNQTATSSISSITTSIPSSSKFLLSSSSSAPQKSSITGTEIVSYSRTTKLATPAIETTINSTTTVRESQISIENKSFDCENQIKQNENSDENQTSKFSSPLDYLRGGSVDVEEQKEPLQNQDQEFEKQQIELEQEQINIDNVIKTKELDDIIVPDTETKLDSDEGEELIANDEEIVSPINQQREKELEEDELQQKLQLQNSIHTIILDNTYNDDFDDEDPDDLTVLDMTTTNMENYLNTININKTNSIIQNLNKNDNSNSSSNLYDSTTFLPSYLNVTSSLTSSSSSLSSGIGLDTISSSLQTSNDLFEITLNTSLSINFTTINNLTSQSIGTTSTSISTLSGTATTTGTSTTSINDFNIFLTEQFSWKNLCLLTIFFTLIVITIIGNTLVILAVITTRRLRTVTNCFVMSLAVADLLVGIFVMPPAVAVHILDSWPFSWILCDIYISLDVLLCTASILSLCAISVDRYLAVTQPLTYSRKRRSKRLALIMILIVWLLALAITCPPILGWYEQGRRDLTYCRYNQNEGYVIFSAMGSFFIPMTVMIYVYARISCVVASRHDNMTDIINNKKSKKTLALDTEAEIDQMSSEQDDKSPGHKKQTAARTLSSQTISRDLNDVIMTSDSDNTGRHLNTKNGSSYELIPTSRTPSFKRQSALCSKHYHQTTQISSLDNKNCASASSEQHQHHHQQQTQQPGKLHWANYGRHSVRMQFVRNTTLILGGGNDSYITRNTRVHHKSLSNRITSLNKENKTTQTLSIVVGGFIVCWLPFFLNYIIAPFLSKEQRYPSLDEFLTWLGWFNSAVNPFIYAFYSVDFRAAFWRLTLKRCYKNSTKNQFPSNTMSIRR